LRNETQQLLGFFTTNDNLKEGVNMLIRERVIKEIESLDTQQLLDIYSIILILKGRKTAIETSDDEPSYLKVQKILSKIEGNLSDLIIEEREDRV
jgi:uncharacterized protein YqgQ